MNSFPNDPFNPFGDQKARDKAWQNFTQAMDPFWNSTQEMLTRLKPKNWNGYRCEVEVQWNRKSREFHFSVRFRDGASNRSKAVESSTLLRLICCLHDAYRTFDDQLEWKKASLDWFWDEENKRWWYRNGVEYGRTPLKTVEGSAGSIGLS